MGAEAFPAALPRLVACCSWIHLDAIPVSSCIASNSRSGWRSAARESTPPVRPKPLIAILADTLVRPADSRMNRKPTGFPNTLSWNFSVQAQKILRFFILADSVFGSSRIRHHLFFGLRTCQCRTKTASVGRSKNTSVRDARRPHSGEPFASPYPRTRCFSTTPGCGRCYGRSYSTSHGRAAPGREHIPSARSWRASPPVLPAATSS